MGLSVTRRDCQENRSWTQKFIKTTLGLPSPTILLMKTLQTGKIITTLHPASPSHHIDHLQIFPFIAPRKLFSSYKMQVGKCNFSLIFYNFKLNLHFTGWQKSQSSQRRGFSNTWRSVQPFQIYTQSI